MSGTKEGAIKAQITNRERYGEDYYSRIAKMPRRSGGTGGFASEKVGKDGLTGPQRASVYGAIGGRKSRRGPAKKKWSI